MKRRKQWLTMLAAVMIVTSVSACSNGSGSGNSDGGNKSGQGQGVDTPSDGGNQPADDGPFSKYETPITVESVLATQGWAAFPEGETWDNDNRWHKLIKETLGIDLKWKWQVDSTQYGNKVNVSIASGDLPDIIAVSKQQLNQLVDADMVEDMTQVFEQYAMPYLKEQVKTGLAPAQSMAMYDGKLMAIPQYQGDPRDSALSLYIRTDWLQKVGLPEPTTVDELIKTAEAFVHQDPNGNGKDDTYGLGLLPSIAGAASMTGFLNGYHAYPSIWIPNSSGQLVYGSTLPEMKEALGKLQQMYKDGLLDREFGTKDFNRLKEDIVAEKVGMFYGTVSESATILSDAMKKNPQSKWKAIALLSADDQPARPSVPVTAGLFYVAKKGFKHPESIMKIMNLFVTKVYGEDGAGTKSENKKYAWVDNAKYAVFPQSPVQGFVKDFNYEAVRDALKSGDGSNLPEELKMTYEQAAANDGTNMDNWQQWWIYQTEVSPFEVRVNYQKDPNFTVVDSYYGGSTKTMDEKAATLFTMESEVFVKIIMNSASVDDFDKFVANWNKLGGEKISEEVNDWYSKNK